MSIAACAWCECPVKSSADYICGNCEEQLDRNLSCEEEDGYPPDNVEAFFYDMPDVESYW